MVIKIENKKFGRPTESPKINQYRIRLSDDELEILEFCCNKTGLSKAEVIRKGIQKVYQEVK